MGSLVVLWTLEYSRSQQWIISKIACARKEKTQRPAHENTTRQTSSNLILKSNSDLPSRVTPFPWKEDILSIPRGNKRESWGLVYSGLLCWGQPENLRTRNGSKIFGLPGPYLSSHALLHGLVARPGSLWYEVDRTLLRWRARLGSIWYDVDQGCWDEELTRSADRGRKAIRGLK